MEHDEDRRAEALDRYWDALGRGERPGPPAEVGEAMAALARHRSAPPAGTDAAQDRVWRTIRPDLDARQHAEETRMQATATLDHPRFAPVPNGRTDPRHGRPASRPIPIAPRGRLGSAASLAAAALLLIALGLGYVALDPFGGGPDRPSSIPAAYAPEATPSPEPTEALLLEVTLPAEVLPHGEDSGAGLGHFTVPPGTRARWTPFCCAGPMVEYVLSGAYTVRVEAAVRVVRADGVTEEIPAGVEVVLGPGDALLTRVESIVEAENTGGVPVELLNWILVDEYTSFTGHLLPGWIPNDIDTKGGGAGPFDVSVPAGSAAMRLQHIELVPNATIAPQPGVTTLAVILPENAAGTPTLKYRVGTQSDGAVKNTGDVAATVYVVTLEPVASGGTPAAGSPTP